MNSQMLIGFGLAALMLIGFVVWFFKTKKPKSEPTQSKQSPNAQVISNGLRSLKTSTALSTQTETVIQAVDVPVTVIPKYKAMVWTDFGIVFKKIPERIGSVFYCDPSMPEKGEHLWVIETIDNGITKYAPYDPREIAIVSEETPEWAFDSIHCYKEVYAWFKNKSDMWDKVNSVLIGLGLAVMGLVCLSVLD